LGWDLELICTIILLKKEDSILPADHAERACSRIVRPATMVIAIVVILIVAAAEMARRDMMISLVRFASATVISFFGNFILLTPGISF